MGNVGDNTLSSYRLRASETQQLSYIPDGRAHRHTRQLSAWLLGGSRRPMQGSVDLVSLLHAEMVNPPEDGHPSRY